MTPIHFDPDFPAFAALMASGAPAVPVVAEILLDTQTPVSAFRRLGREAPAFLLESIEGGEQWGRYSLLGAGARLVFTARGREIEIRTPDGVRRLTADDPLAVLAPLLLAQRPAEIPGMPRFVGGAVGYLSYDLVRRFETLPARTRDDLGLPEIQLMIADTAVVFDNLAHTVKVVHNAAASGDPARDYARATQAVRNTIARLDSPAGDGEPGRFTVADSSASQEAAHERPDGFKSNMKESEFLHAVTRVRDLIHAGEAIQVVLSHRLSRGFTGDPFDTYRALRVINPSPYMYYLDFGDLQIAGASPEVLLRVEGNALTVRPIAGTRRRGETPSEDESLAAELRADEKETAEHLMLVDLGRNDLGRVAAFGSVDVEEFQTLERYSHVMHLVSSVRGRLRSGLDCFAALRACFPAGTVSGAPKVRAMQIIEEVEPTRRGIYAGAVGYIDFRGNLDTAIAIRTLVFTGGRVHLQVGAGIVADSVPERELAETMAKAGALLRAVEMAEQGLRLQRPVPGRKS